MAFAAGERSGNMWEQQPCRPHGQCRRRGRRCARHRSRGSPAAPGAARGEAGCAPAAHGGPWAGSRDPPAARGGPHARAGGCPEEAVTSWESCAGAGSWQDLCTRGDRSPCWSRFAASACDPAGDWYFFLHCPVEKRERESHFGGQLMSSQGQPTTRGLELCSCLLEQRAAETRTPTNTALLHCMWTHLQIGIELYTPIP